jgi:hypothetical protein
MKWEIPQVTNLKVTEKKAREGRMALQQNIRTLLDPYADEWKERFGHKYDRILRLSAAKQPAFYLLVNHYIEEKLSDKRPRVAQDALQALCEMLEGKVADRLLRGDFVPLSDKRSFANSLLIQPPYPPFLGWETTFDAYAPAWSLTSLTDKLHLLQYVCLVHKSLRQLLRTWLGTDHEAEYAEKMRRTIVTLSILLEGLLIYDAEEQAAGK